MPQLIGIEVPRIPNIDERVFPLTRVLESKDISPVVNSLMNLLKIEDEEIEGAVKYSLVELLRNIVQHARSRIGGLVSAVYFPRSGIVDINVADIGCGLRSSLRVAYPEINSDQKAVRFALLPHVSGTFSAGAYNTMRDNAGLGLFFIKEIVSRSGGGFFVGSGTSLADIWGNMNGTCGKKYFTSKNQGWRGTFALLQFRKNTIGEFDSLLQKCREIAATARRDRSELAVDFIDSELDLDGVCSVSVGKFEENVEEAARIRETVILPALQNEEIVVLDFRGVKAATQSFVHALMYRIFRDGKNLATCLSVACADRATEQAIRAVAAYASVEV